MIRSVRFTYGSFIRPYYDFIFIRYMPILRNRFIFLDSHSAVKIKIKMSTIFNQDFFYNVECYK